MSAVAAGGGDRLKGMSEHELLLLMDLAMETLEGLDQIGVETRVELEALMSEVERRVTEDE